MKHTVQTFLSMFGVLFINVFASIILSRGLTPDDRGLYLGVTMWGGFILGLCDIGIYVATVYLWGKCKEHEKKDVFTTLLTWSLVTGAVCVMAVLLLSDWMIKGRLDAQETLAAYIFFGSTFFGPLTTMVNGVLAAEQRFTWVNLVRIGLPVASTAFWLAYFMTGTLSVTVCLITTSVLPLFSLALLLWQIRSRLLSLGRFRLALFKQAAWYGLRGYGGSLINVMGNNSSQLLVFSLTPAALAYFQTAGSAAGVLWSVPRAIATTSFPYMVKTKKEELHGQLCRILRLTALATVLGMIALGAAVPVMVPLFFGSPYAAAVLPALILMPNALLGGLSDVFANALNSTGRTFHTTIANACNVGVTLLTLILTLPYWGLTGAAVSTLLGFFASFAVRLIWYSRTVSRITVRELIPSYSEAKEWAQIGFGAFRQTARKWRRKPSVLER